jgi:hypothetical protein
MQNISVSYLNYEVIEMYLTSSPAAYNYGLIVHL